MKPYNLEIEKWSGVMVNKEQLDIINKAPEPMSKGMGYRVASLAHGANYNDYKDYMLNKSINVRSKLLGSHMIRIPALTLSIFDSVANKITLHFWEYDAKTYQKNIVEFYMECVNQSYKSMIILYGGLKIADRKVKKGYVSYIFEEGKFYRGYVTTYEDFRRQRLLNVDKNSPSNVALVNKLLTHVSNFMYSEEDYENYIDVNGPTRSKFHKEPDSQM